jgi:hypothetical protein
VAHGGIHDPKPAALSLQDPSAVDRPEGLKPSLQPDAAPISSYAQGNDRSEVSSDKYSQLNLPEGPVFDTRLRFGVSEDGSLHAEKYFHTVWDDFQSTRAAFRWRHLTALARGAASEYGYPASGKEEARSLPGV